MAKDEIPSNGRPWPWAGLPIDIACQRLASSLWDTYMQARDAALGIEQSLQRFVPLTLPADQQRCLNAYKEAWDTLEAEVRRRLRGEIELWGRRNRFAELQLIPVSALDGLRLNFAERTADDQAAGERPVLYDLHLKQVGQKATESARDDLHVKEVGQKAAESARAEGTREQPKRKVGRKPEFDWDALHTE